MISGTHQYQITANLVIDNTTLTKEGPVQASPLKGLEDPLALSVIRMYKSCPSNRAS
jgi:hypothetical protein